MAKALLIVILLLSPAGLFGLSASESAYLLQRTGFDASEGSVAALSQLSRNQAVRAIVNKAAASVTHYYAQPPKWTSETPDLLPRPALRGLDKQTAIARRRTYQQELRNRALQLQEWDMEQMIRSPSPLAERMVLFWHNNFTSSLAKVRDAGFLFNQDCTVRRYAFGSFATMLHALAKDPAMIIYLDNETNSKGKPNENFAREVMELFTLGERNYTEPEVKASARAFTGWRVNYRTASFQFDPKRHDDGIKSFMGHTGNLGGDDILNIILQQKAVATFITDKLWREFVSPNPDPQVVARLAEGFRSSGYEIKPLLEKLLETQAFWSQSNRNMLVKSPVVLVVGAVRSLGIQSVEPIRLVRATRALGEDLFNPPTVKGWPVGVEWLNSETLIRRHQILLQLIYAYARDLRGKMLNPTYEVY